MDRYQVATGKAPRVNGHVLDELEWRGLIANSTDLDALRAELSAGAVTLYCGFDPTAPSLHMGNLLQLVTVRRLQDAGHRPLGLVGGATGMIGDPKQTEERRLNPAEVVAEWTERVRRQVARVLSFEGDNAAIVVNNYDWTKDLPTLDFLRDIGKHFPVNKMLARDVVRSRLETGISYTEFSYVLLQSMDYLRLFERYGCRLQTGGSDQWGNITGGVDLIRRVTGERVHALATPLITKADGTKYGKTESGTVWLDPEMMSPYAFYQFWINSDDADVVSLLKYFTFRSRDEIAELEQQVADKPSLRTAQRALADDVTTLVHGADETARVKAAAAALFGGGDLRSLDVATLEAALLEAPHVEIDRQAELPTYVDLLAQTALVASKGAGRRTVAEGGAYINNVRIADAESRPGHDDLLPGGWLILRRGKRSLAGVKVG
ncbi:MAG: tyrosyl-tRNA synthetase [Nocardioidaceae bacterium]|nr:tyrosyl-tRNA synthetase [Nocardioidaceae bacterium]